MSSKRIMHTGGAITVPHSCLLGTSLLQRFSSRPVLTDTRICRWAISGVFFLFFFFSFFFGFSGRPGAIKSGNHPRAAIRCAPCLSLPRDWARQGARYVKFRPSHHPSPYVVSRFPLHEILNRHHLVNLLPNNKTIHQGERPSGRLRKRYKDKAFRDWNN